ncbi:hypothetical protein E2320_002485, partial [Naja naja]
VLLVKKLGSKYIGPFQIIRVINPVTVGLQLASQFKKVHPIFHVSLLKPADMTWQEPRLHSPGPVRDDHYKIDEILDSRCRHGVLQYLVRWTGYLIADASWLSHTAVSASRKKTGRGGRMLGFSNLTDSLSSVKPDT